MSPTQCAAPTAIARVDAGQQALRGAVRARPIGGRQQREQLVRLPAHDHVRVAQAGGQQRREPSAVPSGTLIRTSAKSRP